MNLSLMSPRLRIELHFKRYLRRMIPNPGKPPNLPPSKSMLYRTVDADWMEPHHVEQLLWRRHVYNNAMMAIRRRFRAEMLLRTQASAGIEDLKQQEMEELNQMIAINDQRNAHAAAKREEREKQEMEDLRAETIAEIAKILDQEEDEIRKRTAEVEAVIEASKTFVKRENLRESIEHALENPIVFDYAIDLHGKPMYLSVPVKYLEGQPVRQKGRLYDRTHSQTLRAAPPRASTA